jgi:hypothetical protein
MSEDFISFFKKIKNPNEWRRYQAFRYEGVKSYYDAWLEGES